MFASVRSGPIVGGAHEALEVDEELPAAGIERREGRRREVGPRERAHVDPGRVSRRLDCLLRRPRVADGVLPHDSLLSLVVEAVLGRRRRLVPRDRQAEGFERGEQRRPMLRAARRLDVRVGAQAGQRARRVEDSAAGAGLRALDDVACDVTERGDRRHAVAAPASARRVTTATTLAIPNETTKLGTVAPTPQSGGCSSPTRSTHQAGPVG